MIICSSIASCMHCSMFILLHKRSAIEHIHHVCVSVAVDCLLMCARSSAFSTRSSIVSAIRLPQPAYGHLNQPTQTYTCCRQLPYQCSHKQLHRDRNSSHPQSFPRYPHKSLQKNLPIKCW